MKIVISSKKPAASSSKVTLELFDSVVVLKMDVIFRFTGSGFYSEIKNISCFLLYLYSILSINYFN